MGELLIYKKPQLAVLEAYKKMRDYTPEERYKFAADLVVQLITDLGIRKNTAVKQNLDTIDHVVETFGTHTPEEIKHALKLFISLKLNLEIIHVVSPLVFSKVMQAYDNHKAEKLRTYRADKQKNQLKAENMLTEDEKTKIMQDAYFKIKTEFKTLGKIINRSHHIYDWLETAGKINYDVDFKMTIWNRAKIIAKSELTEKAITKKEHQKACFNIDNNSEPRVKIIAKRLSLEHYFTNL